MKEVKTQGNFMVCGSAGERRAAFALESDRQLFDAAKELLKVLKDIVESTEPYWEDAGEVYCTFCGRELENNECTSDDCLGVRAQRAIAKAEGKEEVA